VFALPCPALADGFCSIYHQQRPRACGWFECDLVAAVRAGRETPRSAGEVIARTKALRDRARTDPTVGAELQTAVRTHFRAAAPE
jgi:hypothetical protein